MTLVDYMTRFDMIIISQNVLRIGLLQCWLNIMRTAIKSHLSAILKVFSRQTLEDKPVAWIESVN